MRRSLRINLMSGMIVGVLACAASASVVIQPDEAGGKDVFTYQGLPTFNFETSGPMFQRLLATSETNTGHITHSFLQFDLSGVPFASGDVASATLNLYAIDGAAVFGGAFVNPSPDAPIDVQARGVLGSWQESVVTYNSEPAVSAAVAGSSSLDGVNRWLSIDITDLVKDWLDGTMTNNGVFLRQAAQVADPNSGSLVGAVYDSSSGANRPYLEIVPEPATLALVGIGAMTLIYRRRRIAH